jgi:hypothetical protein
MHRPDLEGILPVGRWNQRDYRDKASYRLLSELSTFFGIVFSLAFFLIPLLLPMKGYLFFLAALLAGSTAGLAQKISATRVPAVVRATFEARFPAVKSITWKKELQQVRPVYEYETHNDFRARDAFLTEEVYEASFRLTGQEMSVLITPTGLLQETETEMAATQLPAAVLASLARDFNTYQVREAATIIKADGSTVYEAEIALAGKKQDVHFTADGQLAGQ